MKLLVVDDSETARRMLRQLLAPVEGLAVVGEATSGEDAIARVSEIGPDVVVMDWHMPGMSGVEATARILGLDPDVCVVGVTATEDGAIHQAYREAGAIAVFAKQHDLQLREYLRSRRSARDGWRRPLGWCMPRGGQRRGACSASRRGGWPATAHNP